MASTTISSLTPKPGSYTLREKTTKKRAETDSKPIHYSKRATLSPSKTASLIRENGHDCKAQEDVFIKTKVIARLFHSLFRFSFSYSFDCETSRGQTHLNGSVASCGGCQAAHAALSPTLYDNILELIVKKIDKVKFTDLAPHEKLYLEVRFSLTDDEISELSSDDAFKRIDQISELCSRLTLAEKKGTFANSPVENERNATYENPTASNRFDCYLEHHLRPLEDSLANEKKEPIEALKTLQAEYIKITETAIQNLNSHFGKLNELQSSWNAMTTSQSTLELLDSESQDYEKEFKTYLKHVETYRGAFDKLFASSQGTPSLDFLSKHLKDLQSPFVLKTVAKYSSEKEIDETISYFEANKNHLQIDLNAHPKFTEAHDEIERRLHEATIQLGVLGQQHDDIKQMLKHLFGEMDKAAKRIITPTKKRMQQRFVELIPPKPASKVRKLTHKKLFD